MNRQSTARWLTRATTGVLVATGGAAAHGGGLRGATPEKLAIPTWLFLLTGGAVVAASFLLASFVTDRAFIESMHERSSRLAVPRSTLAWVGRAVGVVGLAAVISIGLVGPADPLRNAAILLVWAGWWAGFPMSVYLVGNSWPALNPFRTLTRALPRLGSLTIDADRAGWLSAAALLALVWFEVVSPLADDPRLLAAAAVGYLLFAGGGVLAFGHETWFDQIDPLARVFRAYGGVAPVQRTADGLQVRVPGSALAEDVLGGRGGVGFVVALVWGTTFDGLVTTPAWATVARTLVTAGIPAHVVYPAALFVGFLAFYRGFRLAAQLARRTAPTYRDADELARRFAPPLVAIAAGYHLAHYLGYFLALLPALVSALANPLSPPAARYLVTPGWFGALPLVFVLCGHLLAVWISHTVAYDLFPGRLQAVRSQYPLTAIMIGYTMVSLWIVSQPSITPPYL